MSTDKKMIAIATDFMGSDGDPEAAMQHIARAGFTHLHWCHQWCTDHYYSDREIAKIAIYLQNTGLKLLDIHGSDGGGMNGLCSWYSCDETYRQAGVDLVLNRLRMHAMLKGEGTLMMHIPYVRVGDDEARKRKVWKHIDALRRSLDELVPASLALGIPLALENMACDTFEVLSKLFEEYPAEAVGLCYDSGHANIRDCNGEAHGIEHFEEHLGRLQALHLHDNDGSGDQHQPPFYGNVDWKRIASDIDRSAYKRVISFELSMRDPAPKEPAAFTRDAYERCLRVSNFLA